jgi:uncharacterized membrane protein YozB (DUF420 family)
MPARVNDRRLYIFAAILTPLIVLAGFARTYYLKPFFSTPDLPGRIVHLHGIVMTAWVALFVAQISLVAKRRVRTHQRLGMLGAGLAAMIVIVGVLTALYAAARGASPGPPALAFLIIPIGDMLIFSVLIGLALYYRRKPQVHKRLMLLAAINLLTPAIARIPLSFIINGGPLAFFGLTDLVLLVAVAFDTLKHRRLHPVFLWGSIGLILMQPLRLLLAGTALWLNFAAALVALVK